MWNFLKGMAKAAATARLYRRFPLLVAGMWAWNFYQQRKARRSLTA